MLDRDALERFVDEYADRAYRFAYGLCGNEPDARELVQEAFVKLFDKAEQYDESLPLDNWFLALLKNLFFDMTRRWERRRGISFDTPVGPGGLTLADALPDQREEALIDRLERERDGALVRRALEEMTPDARAILMMVHVEGLGYEEAASVLGCPLGTVRSRLNRARGVLRDKLLRLEVST